MNTIYTYIPYHMHQPTLSKRANVYSSRAYLKTSNELSPFRILFQIDKIEEL